MSVLNENGKPTTSYLCFSHLSPFITTGVFLDVTVQLHFFWFWVRIWYMCTTLEKLATCETLIRMTHHFLVCVFMLIVCTHYTRYT